MKPVNQKQKVINPEDEITEIVKNSLKKNKKALDLRGRGKRTIPKQIKKEGVANIRYDTYYLMMNSSSIF